MKHPEFSIQSLNSHGRWDDTIGLYTDLSIALAAAGSALERDPSQILRVSEYQSNRTWAILQSPDRMEAVLRPRTSASCGWCHEMNPAEQRYCSNCGHEAHRTRSHCECPACTTTQQI